MRRCSQNLAPLLLLLVLLLVLLMEVGSCPRPNAPAVVAAAEDATAVLGTAGRLLLRRSGTEPLVRVMVEAERERDVATVAEAVATAVRGATARLRGAA